ncbi:hypothetical protein M8C21_007951 [Ambrosia artemisiifolia]|uniref:Uncharacterized protein n=1 Tax=Ambrosia artemisiifolia TaxID=4212 RepID=A0AAD5G7S6_AMBAR|nr:hypothetical protein M8C21_007951 [Ambrosia artemisiifolia]
MAPSVFTTASLTPVAQLQPSLSPQVYIERDSDGTSVKRRIGILTGLVMRA